MDKKTLNIIKDYINEFKTLKMMQLPNQEPSFMSIKSFACELNNKVTIVREQCLRNNQEGHVVTILPVTTNHRVVMVAQPRVFTSLTVGFEFPAGYVDYGEEPMEAAKRELLEETGYQAMEIEKLIAYQGDPGCSGAFNHCFIATGCEKVCEQNLDESEYVGFFECSLDDANEMLESGLIVGSSSIVTLQKVYEKRDRYGI